jgi:hypothetical protein
MVAKGLFAPPETEHPRKRRRRKREKVGSSSHHLIHGTAMLTVAF